MNCKNYFIAIYALFVTLLSNNMMAEGSSGIVTNKVILEELIQSEELVVRLLQDFVNFEKQKIEVVEA